MWVGADIRNRQRRSVQGDPSGDTLAELRRGIAAATRDMSADARAAEMRRKGIERAKLFTWEAEILARLGIAENRLGRPVEQMSRGMQQKVAIARALLTSPTLLLLDEPTTGLDPRSKLDVQTFIEDVRAAHDATILLTTHDMAEADRLCDRIGILDRGRLVAEDTPDGLKARVARETGLQPTLDNVFLTYTGRSLDEDVEEAAPEDDE